MTILTTILNGSHLEDVRLTLNAMLADVAALKAGGTPAPSPTLALSSAVTQAEGNSGTKNFVWTLTLTRNGSTASFPFTWAVTGNGSNPANAADFGGTLPSGSGTFAPGETTKTITVVAAGDAAVEPDETFLLTVTAAGLNTVSSTGTISNDDSASAFNTIVIEGDSITNPGGTPDPNSSPQPSDGGGSHAFRWRATRSDKAIWITGVASRVAARNATLNDGGNSMLGHVADDLAHGPQLIFTCIGGNDMAVGYTGTAYKADIAGLKTRYNAAGVKFAWGGVFPFNDNQAHPNYAEFTGNRNQVMANIRDPAVWGPLCDYYIPLSENPDLNAAPNGAFYQDGTHPSVSGQASNAAIFIKAMDALVDATRVTSTAIYNSAWPPNETGLDLSATITRKLIVSGIAHVGTNLAITVSGAQIRLGTGGWGTSLNQQMYNGDVIGLRLTTSASNDTPVSVSLTINGDTRTITYRTVVASIYVAKFNPAAKSPNTLLTVNNTKMNGQDFGSPYPFKVIGDTALTDTSGYVEFLYEELNTSYSGPRVGVAAATYDATTTTPLFGTSAGSISAGAGGLFVETTTPVTGPNYANGERIGIFVHKTTKKLWFRTASGWFPDTPVVNADGSLNGSSGAGITASFDIAYFGSAQTNQNGFTVNGGQSAFTYGPPANGKPGWK